MPFWGGGQGCFNQPEQIFSNGTMVANPAWLCGGNGAVRLGFASAPYVSPGACSMHAVMCDGGLWLLALPEC